MKITKILFVLTSVACAMLVNAGPVTGELAAQKGASAESTDLAISSLLEVTTITTDASSDVVAKSATGTDLFAGFDSLVYSGSNFGTQSMSGNLPTTSASGITEPASLALLGAGLIGLALLRRR